MVSSIKHPKWYASIRVAVVPVLAAWSMIGTPAFALSVTQPTASTVVVAGDDYATQVLGNPWDMSDAPDIDVADSDNVSGASVNGGIFSATTTSGQNDIFPLFGGYGGSLNTSRGYQHPIDTSHYRYFTFKMYMAHANELALLYFLQGDTGTRDAHQCGATSYAGGTYLPVTTWTVFRYDLYSDIVPTSVCPRNWTDFATIGALQFVPALDSSSTGGATFAIDWMRLTAPATAAQKVLVQWTDTGYSGTYSLTLNETGSNPASFVLATAVSGNSYSADVSFFPPGQYTITVSRTAGGATSNSAAFRINSPPLPALTKPDVHGDQSRNFASVVMGNPWGPIDAGDFLPGNGIVNFKVVPPNSSYFSYKPGAFYGRPTNSDPEWFMNTTNHAIDTSLYRSLCFTMEDYGPRFIGEGSIARFFWGTLSSGAITTSQDIPLYAGLNEYCFADLALVPTETGGTGGTWSGLKTLFRVDPHEFSVSTACVNNPSPSNCHDVELDSVVLAPFYTAAPGFTFSWTVADSDDSSVNVSLHLVSDASGASTSIYSASAATSAGGTPGQYAWPGSGSINYGLYHAVIVGDDGRNSVAQTSSGPLLIGPSDGIFRNGFDVN